MKDFSPLLIKDAENGLARVDRMGTEVDTTGVDTTGGQQGTATELEELDIDLPKKVRFLII